MRIGFVGAGRIGRPMVTRLVGAGHQVHVSTRSAEGAEWAVAAGATPVSGVAAVAEGADAVAVCVLTDAQVREVCLADGLVDALESGAVLIVHTTASPVTMADLAARAADRDVAVVDAPSSGGPHDIDSGAVTLFVGAGPEGLDRARPALQAFGDPILEMGGVGAGQTTKLVNNAVFAANIGLLADAARLATQLGADEHAVLDGMQHASGSSRALAMIARAGSVDKFAGSVGQFVGKDLATVRTLATELGADLGALVEAHDTLEGLLDRYSLGPASGGAEPPVPAARP